MIDVLPLCLAFLGAAGIFFVCLLINRINHEETRRAMVQYWDHYYATGEE